MPENEYYELIKANPDLNKYFYPLKNSEEENEVGYVGVLRGYFFDSTGHLSFTWQDGVSDLNNAEFKNEFQKMIDFFYSEDGFLRDKRNFRNLLRNHNEATLANDSDWIGLVASTENYTFFFRMHDMPGDYNIYIRCYDTIKLIVNSH